MGSAVEAKASDPDAKSLIRRRRVSNIKFVIEYLCVMMDALESLCLTRENDRGEFRIAWKMFL